MSVTTRIKLANIISSTAFWVAVIISFFQSKGFTLSEVYFLVTFFSVSVVFLEYPTGVIGDYFSHKLSVQLGLFICALAISIGTLQMPKFMYFGVLFVWAIGNALESGSDIALLHKNSKNFKKDVSDIRVASIIALAIGTAIGGWVARYNINYPMYMTAATKILAGLMLLGVTNEAKDIKKEGNIFAKARKGLVILLKDKTLLAMMTIGAVFNTLILGLKWFYNTLFENLSLPTQYWGILVSISMGLIALGSFIARKTEKVSITKVIIAVTVTFTLIGITNKPLIVLGALFLYSLFHGLYDVLYENKINQKIEDGFRASILSAKSLGTRILYALYTFMAGVALNYISVYTFFVITSAVVIVIVLINYKSAKLS